LRKHVLATPDLVALVAEWVTTEHGGIIVKRRSSLALAAGALLAATLPGAVAAQDEVENVPVLYVVSAGSGSVEGDTPTLDAVPSVLWFTDQPDRWAGQIEPADLEALWAEGQDGFADDPPNAVLSILDTDTTADAVIELIGIASHTDHVGAPDDMAFTFEVLDGELPDGAIGTASLFIEDWEGTRSTSRDARERTGAGEIEQGEPVRRLDGLILNFRTVSGR
jgi:hypothetical protein